MTTCDHLEIDTSTIWLREAGTEDEASAVLARLTSKTVSSPAEVCLIAEEVMKEPHAGDLARSILWVAASLGSRRAADLLAGEIETLLSRSNGAADADRRRMVHLAAEWRRSSTKKKFHHLSRLSSAEYDDGGRLIEEVVQIAVRPADGIVVVSGIEAGDGEERAGLRRSYDRVIGRRLPLHKHLPAPNEIASALLAKWPWATELADRLEDTAAFCREIGCDRVVMGHLVLVGPSGVGKTSLALALADVLRLPKRTIDAASGEGKQELAAVPREYRNSRPCAPIEVMQASSCANPMIVIDNIDREMAAARPGRCWSTMSAMLDHSRAYYDACFMTQTDLSAVTFVATATDMQALPSSVRERFEVIRIPRPRPQDLSAILTWFKEEAAVQYGVHRQMLPILEDSGLSLLEDRLRSGDSLRSLARLYRRLLVVNQKADRQVSVN